MGKLPKTLKEGMMNINGSYAQYGVSAYSSYGSSATTNDRSAKFAEALLSVMDADASGEIDSAEFSKAALELSFISDESAISEAFGGLDTDENGSIGLDELSSAFSQMAAQGTMAAGGPPPPHHGPPPSKSEDEEDTGYTVDELTTLASEVSSTDSALASLFETLASNFETADANGDGKVTSAEAMAYQQSTQTDSAAQATTAANGAIPPPLPRSGGRGEDTGFTQEELTAMASDTSTSESKLTSLFETLATNFDAADENGDGRVTAAEAMAYEKSAKEESIGSTGSREDAMMKNLLAQIISSYATQNTYTSSSSINLSA